MLENITDNMNEDGQEGIWYSYIKDMETFRVRLLEGRYTVFSSNGETMNLTKEDVASIVLREVKDETIE